MSTPDLAELRRRCDLRSVLVVRQPELLALLDLIDEGREAVSDLLTEAAREVDQEWGSGDNLVNAETLDWVSADRARAWLASLGAFIDREGT